MTDAVDQIILKDFRYFNTELSLLSHKKAILVEEAAKNWEQWIVESIIRGMSQLPKIVKVQWQQYTPYFNDGDNCEFDICEPYFYDEDDNEIYDGVEEAFDDFYSLYGKHDIVLKVFGDHREITFENGELTHSYYDHS